MPLNNKTNKQIKIQTFSSPTLTEVTTDQHLSINASAAGCINDGNALHTATCLPSQKLSKLEEPDMQDTAGEARMSS